MKNVTDTARVQSLLNPVESLYTALESMGLIMDLDDGRYIRTDRNDKISDLVNSKIGHASVQMAAFFRYRQDALDILLELVEMDENDSLIKMYNEDLLEVLIEAEGCGYRFIRCSKIEIPETVEATEEAAPEAAETTEETPQETVEETTTKGNKMTYSIKENKITARYTDFEVYMGDEFCGSYSTKEAAQFYIDSKLIVEAVTKEEPAESKHNLKKRTLKKTTKKADTNPARTVKDWRNEDVAVTELEHQCIEAVKHTSAFTEGSYCSHPEEVASWTGIDSRVLRGVISSLIKKDLAYMDTLVKGCGQWIVLCIDRPEIEEAC